MSTSIVRTQSPEEREYARYLVQIEERKRIVADLRAELEGPVFGSLRDIEQFKRFSVAYHTLTWPNGADFAPEFLRERVAVTV